MFRRQMARFALALVGASLLPAAISVAPAYALIGGSYTTNPGSVVALTYRAALYPGSAADREFCTGTLIAPRWVLTAAHCLEGTRLAEYEIVLGRTTLSAAGGEVIAPLRQWINPKYRSSGANGHDVGLIHLGRVAKETPSPVASGASATLWAPGMSMLVMGWGYTCPAEKTSCQGDTLKSAASRVVTDVSCAQAMGRIAKSTEICTKTSNVSLGGGDSGGPAFVNTSGGRRLVAVNSWGQVDGQNRDVVGGWMGYAEVAGTELATWVSSTITSNS